ncbi:zinc finger C3H1 domain-containing protein-like isoform X2 [Polyodon spathula]|uniref:zinc finger C3H1 domain-containing protein-like isoform X2 n=1 Tax=Polyodon spathula TaxID=7913 RepID=UPI001B7DCD48|nr:zinc finger C3H1 domain-containing protein-like isoform X2 [Polyodon spathula]
MALNSSNRSPREEGELEDGEISDEDNDENQLVCPDKRPSSSGNNNAGRSSRSCKPQPRPLSPHIGGPGHDYRLNMQFNRGPHPPKSTGHRQKGGPNGPGRPGSGPLCESGPRSSFWERSNSAFDRLGHRGRWSAGRGDRGERGTGRPPPGRVAFTGSSNRKESPPRKPKTFGRPPLRKPNYSTVKNVNGIEDSFEELLKKYKQIQHELECIRKEERTAFTSKEEPPRKEPAVSVSDKQSIAVPSSIEEVDGENVDEAVAQDAQKPFQAFNLKPLRQKLLTPAERDQINKVPGKEEPTLEEIELSLAESSSTAKESVETDLSISYASSKESDDLPEKEVVKDDDDEVSEMQLRLLALQSASKKWQQKEQQVLKESKEKLSKTRPAQQKSKAAVKPHCGKKGSSTGSAAKQAWRKQQLRTWKLQQQKEQEKRQREDEEKRRAEEEEERRKREEEIRKIRDLSNQDEQYNRFMKLVGGKRSSRSKTSDSEHRKSLSKQGTDASGNLYQYDNYDEVAMETDSETSSPVSSPMHNPFVPELPPYFQMAPFPIGLPPHTVSLNEQYLDSLDAMEPPPPLPPLPPDEPEQPPKPPFADEEEEEEMLLREELLKSLASKRPVKSEDTSSNSSPPSPPMTITVQCFPRNNLSAVGINTASHSRSLSTAFVRGPPAPRPLLVLPRHKAVVVQLNNSDDSESDSESSSSSRFVFGGLESMIKEARRTAEASKPKTPSTAEKENNQVKTPEALPVDKKVEYRLLKEEIASREQQRIFKSSQSRGSPSPASSDVELDFVGRTVANLQVSEAENKLMKHKNLLMKDEMLLKHLVQQELKKKESLKASESKSAGLKEQLLATEKIVNANKMLLKKLQEQIHRVQHRVSTKRNQALKFEKDLAQAKANAGHGRGKRKSEVNYLPPSKLLRLDPNSPGSPGKQYTERIAQEKKRLQQLESEYALKIQKLKEAQALRSKELSAESVVSTEEELPGFSIPQPSLHDLTQDKLTLDSEENEVEDEVLSPSVRERRRSFRESSAFTKPNLKHTESLGKPAKKTTGEPELFLGLNVDDLQKLYKEGDSLKELLEKSSAPMLALTGLPALGQEVPVDLDAVMAQTVRGDLKPASFGPYHSPLLVFKSYRFSPYFRTKEKLYLSSASYSNIIEPKKCFCRFDLTGTCNDDDCQWQHMRDCTLSRSQLFQDILSYNLPVVGCSETSTGEEISVATEKYLDKLFGMNKDRMATDPMAVLLVSKINESKGHTPPYTTCKELRKWRPQQRRKPDPDSSSSDDEESKVSVRYDRCSQRSWKVSCALDVCVTPDDVRYFTSETDDISNLEASVVESPRDVQLWIKLAYKYLNQKESTPSECLDSVLNTLARALEDNRENPEVWCHYLNLFTKRGTKDEVQEMCETAVEYAPDYKVWWNFLNLETSFDGKDYVCGRMLQFLLGTAGGDNKSELLSFQLLESLLYRVQLSLFTGRHQNALAILQNALKSTDGERSLAEHLLLSDRCLAWLAYIHLIEFNSLPGTLYDPAHTNPGRIVNKEPFLIPWQSLQDVKTDPDMLFALFEDSVRACSDESLSPGERTAACLPIYRNMIVLNQVLDRWEAAVKLCETLLVPCPDCCILLESLAQLYLKREEADKAIDVWLGAFRKNPHNAQIFHSTCKFLVLQEKSHTIAPLFQEFVLSFCESTQSEQHPANVLRFLLNDPLQYKFKAPCVKQELRDQLSSQIPYMWLIHCLWQSIHASVGDAVDAFERALGTVMQQDVVRKLWLDYLLFTSSKLIGSKTKNRDFRMFTDLVHRCLVTVPTRFIIPLSSADYWTNFEFHNKIISFYLSCLPKSQHSKALERFRYIMPANTDLALRLLRQEWQDGNIQHLKHQARTLTSSAPVCLTIWKIAIAVEKELKGLAEARHLYRQALQKLPLCATLWRDRLLFEASEGGKTDNLRKLVAKCQEVGVSLDELLNLSSNRPEGKDH